MRDDVSFDTFQRCVAGVLAMAPEEVTMEAHLPHSQTVGDTMKLLDLYHAVEQTFNVDIFDHRGNGMAQLERLQHDNDAGVIPETEALATFGDLYQLVVSKKASQGWWRRRRRTGP
jgi:hypothetical protein